MRLCYLANPNSTHTRRWVSWFARQGHETLVIANHPPEIPWPEIKLSTLQSNQTISWLKYPAWLAQTCQLIKSWQPDVLHAHQVTSAGWLGAFSGFHPFVITPWGSDLYEQPSESRLAVWLARYVLSRADWVTADSQDLLQLAIQFGASNNNSSLIQWGVDLDTFHPAGIDCPGCLRLEAAIGLQDQQVVLSPRGMQPIYNLDRIIATIPIVLQANPNTVYILRDYIATPGYRAQLEQQATRLGVNQAIRWIGSIEPWEEIAHCYHLADVAISIPASDATPVSLLEAMACGVPVIASDVMSLREWITSGENGLLVDPGDVGGLARTILSVLKNPGMREKFFAQNLDMLKEKANYQEEMKKMDALYQQLAARTRYYSAHR
jgi:glycosyltransferase involved in cell wall biosynthesis